MSNVKETLAPDSARGGVSYNHVGRRTLTPEIVKEAMTVFILYVITYVIGALVGIAHGFEAIPAIFESVAMTSNGGIITSVAGPGMAGTLELFYIFQMWAGRLEFMTLFALIWKWWPPWCRGLDRRSAHEAAGYRASGDRARGGSGRAGPCG